MKHHHHQQQQEQQPRKRTRTSPNQLSVLENTFTVNPSPNGRMREQLSRQLNMTERSIQIWFQNRRAKEKNLARRTCIAQNRIWRMQQLAAEAASNACQQHNSKDPQMYYYYYYYYYNQQQTVSPNNNTSNSSNPHTLFAHPPPPPPPPPPTPLRAHSLEPGTALQHQQQHHHQQQQQQQVRHQRGATMPILSTATANESWSPTNVFQSYPVLSRHDFSIDTLEIGTWKRVMLQPNDLQCYCDTVQRSMTWVIQDGSYSFKMTFDLEAVQAIQLDPITNDRLEIRLTLDEKKCGTMAFYMHDPLNGWTQCRDFTQDKQATSERVHRLSGPALNIWAEWQSLLQNLSESDPFHHKMFINTDAAPSSSLPTNATATTAKSTSTSSTTMNTTANNTTTTTTTTTDSIDHSSSETPTITISANP
ncbi:homeobox domain-containing protein [Circinella umbellata]|nr:homeobox domain-containing protein [Circinella umbellata]